MLCEIDGEIDSEKLGLIDGDKLSEIEGEIDGE